jgi:hypothetical protein
MVVKNHLHSSSDVHIQVASGTILVNNFVEFLVPEILQINFNNKCF